MKALLLTLALMASACQATESILVIGDSISFASNSWANQWRDQGNRNLKLLAQSGRAVVDYDIPRDLLPYLGIVDVYYALGSNDIGREEHPGQVNFYLRQHIDSLVARGFQVTLVRPPRFEHSDRIRALYPPLCAKVARCVDLQDIWHAVETSDGVHPTTAGQLVIL